MIGKCHRPWSLHLNEQRMLSQAAFWTWSIIFSGQRTPGMTYFFSGLQNSPLDWKKGAEQLSSSTTHCQALRLTGMKIRANAYQMHIWNNKRKLQRQRHPKSSKASSWLPRLPSIFTTGKVSDSFWCFRSLDVGWNNCCCSGLFYLRAQFSSSPEALQKWGTNGSSDTVVRWL